MWEEEQFKKRFKWYSMNVSDASSLTMAVSQYDESSENKWDTVFNVPFLIIFFQSDWGSLPIFALFKNCSY